VETSAGFTIHATIQLNLLTSMIKWLRASRDDKVCNSLTVAIWRWSGFQPL